MRHIFSLLMLSNLDNSLRHCRRQFRSASLIRGADDHRSDHGGRRWKQGRRLATWKHRNYRLIAHRDCGRNRARSRSAIIRVRLRYGKVEPPPDHYQCYHSIETIIHVRASQDISPIPVRVEGSCVGRHLKPNTSRTHPAVSNNGLVIFTTKCSAMSS